MYSSNDDSFPSLSSMSGDSLRSASHFSMEDLPEADSSFDFPETPNRQKHETNQGVGLTDELKKAMVATMIQQRKENAELYTNKFFKPSDDYFKTENLVNSVYISKPTSAFQRDNLLKSLQFHKANQNTLTFSQLTTAIKTENQNVLQQSLQISSQIPNFTKKIDDFDTILQNENNLLTQSAQMRTQMYYGTLQDMADDLKLLLAKSRNNQEKYLRLKAIQIRLEESLRLYSLTISKSTSTTNSTSEVKNESSDEDDSYDISVGDDDDYFDDDDEQKAENNDEISITDTTIKNEELKNEKEDDDDDNNNYLDILNFLDEFTPKEGENIVTDANNVNYEVHSFEEIAMIFGESFIYDVEDEALIYDAEDEGEEKESKNEVIEIIEERKVLFDDNGIPIPPPPPPVRAPRPIIRRYSSPNARNYVMEEILNTVPVIDPIAPISVPVNVPPPIQSPPPAPVSTTFECDICMLDCEKANSFACQFDPNSHRFCLPCVKSYIEETKLSEANTQITCMYSTCSYRLSDQEIQRLVSEEAFAKYMRLCFLQNLSADADNEVIYCSTPFCATPLKKMGKYYECTSCNVQICALCGKDYHPKLSCKKAAKKGDATGVDINAWMRQLNVRGCPRCRVPIEKNEGCNHMTCYSCGYHFCWLCNKEISGYGHFSEDGPCYDKGFYQPTEEELREIWDSFFTELKNKGPNQFKNNNKNQKKKKKSKVAKAGKLGLYAAGIGGGLIVLGVASPALIAGGALYGVYRLGKKMKK